MRNRSLRLDGKRSIRLVEGRDPSRVYEIIKHNCYAQRTCPDIYCQHPKIFCRKTMELFSKLIWSSSSVYKKMCAMFLHQNICNRPLSLIVISILSSFFQLIYFRLLVFRILFSSLFTLCLFVHLTLLLFIYACSYLTFSIPIFILLTFAYVIRIFH
jgi:hypothetical protein